MGDMIKQVAQAIRSGMESSGVVSLVANGPKGEVALQQFFEVLAMDAIEAMREPTDEMASHPMATCYNPGPYGDKEVRRIWRSMVNVALISNTAEPA